MPKLIRLYGYELKNAYKYMCKSILVVSLIAMICLASVYGYVKYISTHGEDSRMTLGVVLNDSSDMVFPELVDFANNISSLKGFCRLEIFDEKEAFEKLESGEIRMVMEVPEGFMEAAEHMQDTQILLYTKGELTSAEYKILGLFHGVEGIMLNTEGAIRAMYAGMELYSFTCSRSEMENDIMELYVMNFLGRESYFDEVFVSPYGDYSVVQHYVIAVLLLLSALSGLAYFGLYNRQEKRIETIMSCGTLNKLLTAFAKIICIALPLISQMWIFLLLGKLIVKRYNLVGTYIEADAFAITALVGISIAGIVHLTASIIDRQSERMTVYCLLMILLFLLSGVISSAYYLPDFVRNMTGLWPVASWHQMIMGAIWGGLAAKSLLVCTLETVVIAILGIAVYSRSLGRHE